MGNIAFSKETYIERRKKLRNEMVDKGIVLILGNVEVARNYAANTYKFRQNSNFLYFFGIDKPGIAAAIDLDSGDDYIFGDEIKMEQIIWHGPQPSVQERAAAVGVTHVKTIRQMYEMFKMAVNLGRPIHFLPPYTPAAQLWLESLLGIPALKTNAQASKELIRAVVKLRSFKEEQEIAQMDYACDIAYQMHTAVMCLTKPGVAEQTLVAELEKIGVADGGETSFQTILSKHGEVFHGNCHDNILQTGDLLLVDAGYEAPSHYVSDITRVVPVGGKFSSQQRDIYEIVLAMNNSTTAKLCHGITYQELHLQASRVLIEGLQSVGLMRGSVDDALECGAQAVFFTHGLGHMLGLDAHDMEDLGEDFVGYDVATHRMQQFGACYLRLGRAVFAGFCLTNEPGIYFIPELIDMWAAAKRHAEFINYDVLAKYRNFGGIRIEDDLLVTENGCRILGKQRVPATIAEVEALVPQA